MASIAGCVLELDGAVSVALRLPGRKLLSAAYLFTGRAVARGVLRELFKTIGCDDHCQPPTRLPFWFLRHSAGPHVGETTLLPFTQRSNVKPSIRRQRRGALSPWKQPIAVTWVWNPAGPLGSRPGSNAWTALRLTPQPADSRRCQPAHPIMSRCEALT